MTTAFRDVYPDLFDTRVLKIFTYYDMQDEPYYTKYLKMVPVKNRHVDAIRLSGLGNFRTKPEGSPISYDAPTQGSRRRLVVQAYALGFQATREAMMDAVYNELDKMPQDLARSGKEHKETLGIQLLDDSFAGAIHTGLDGLSLVNTAHTMLKAPVVGTTLSNALSPGIDFGVEGLEAAMTNLSLTQSEEGRQIGQSFPGKWVAHHPQIQHLVHTTLDTDRGRPGTDLNDINTVARSRTGIQPLMLPHLSDPESWWLMGDPNRTGCLAWYDREEMVMDRSIDADTKNRKYDAMYRAAVGIDSWRGIVGSSV